jgi:hypothetical protein
MNNFNLRKFLKENKLTSNSKLLKEELTYDFDEVNDAIYDPAYKAEVEAGIKRQLPDISDKDLKAIIDSSVEYYSDEKEEDVPSGDIVDMAVDYYNDEMAGDSNPSAPRKRHDLSNVDLSGLDKGQKKAFDKFVDVYLNPYGVTDTQEDLERYVRQFGKIKNAYDFDHIIPNSFQYDREEREAMQHQLKKAYLAEGLLFEEEQWFDPSSPSHGKGYKVLGDKPQEGAFYVSGYDFENDKSFEHYVLDPNYNKYLTATQELLGLADEQGHEYESIEQYYDTVESFQNDLRSYAKGGKFEGDEVPNWLMQDLAMSFGTDYDQFYSDDEDEDEDDH